MSQVYVRKFSERNVHETDTESYPFSKYFPQPIKSAFLKSCNGYMRKTDYVLGPIYSELDFQVGVTGSVEHGEPYKLAIARELGEEIGLIPSHERDLELISSYRHKGRTTNVYELYIKHSQPVLEHQHLAKLSKTRDNRKKKVGCFVYGTKKDILDFLGSDSIYIYDSTYDIIGVAAVKVSDVLKHYTS